MKPEALDSAAWSLIRALASAAFTVFVERSKAGTTWRIGATQNGAVQALFLIDDTGITNLDDDDHDSLAHQVAGRVEMELRR